MYKQSAFGRVKPRRELSIPENYSGSAFIENDGGFTLYEANAGEVVEREETLGIAAEPIGIPTQAYDGTGQSDHANGILSLGRIADALNSDSAILLLCLLVLLLGGGERDDGAIIIIALLLMM